jgi:hypothetical protein
MYHRYVLSKSRFTSIDAQIWRLLWIWALRRHPSKKPGKVVRMGCFVAISAEYHGIFNVLRGGNELIGTS